MRPWLTKVPKWGWKWRWLILIGFLAATCIACWPEIAAWLKAQFPGKTKWDWIEKVLIPIAPPAAIGFGVWFLDKSAKDRESQREQSESKNQALQLYYDRVSSILLGKQVISLAEAAKKLGPEYKDPLVESARDVVRAQTLAILRVFSADQERKSSVVRFLIESEILSSLTVSLDEADLSVANLIGANLSGGILSWANLSAANLSAANLNMANLIGANLSGANLRLANLSAANLRLANLNKANLVGAKLIGANLIEADLQNVQWDDDTIWPSPDRFKDAKNIPPALKKQLGL